MLLWKGMLQHSRSAVVAAKELTDIFNKLGWWIFTGRVIMDWEQKIKASTQTMQTNFDKNIHKLLIVPQDIGRGCLIFLTTLPLSSVNEKLKQQLQIFAYYSMISVRLISGSWEGSGWGHQPITETAFQKNIIDKIFSHFFLPPSHNRRRNRIRTQFELWYYVKAHGGEIKGKRKKMKKQHLLFNYPSIKVLNEINYL